MSARSLPRIAAVLTSVLAVAGSIVVLVAPLAGCDDEKKITPPPPSDYLPQSSPANVLQNFKTAYEAKKLDEYLKLFSPDFKFVFNPDDANDPVDPTPPEWGFAEERMATEHMFTDSLVESIQLDLAQQGTPERADSLIYGPRAWRMRVEEANLRVNTRNQNHEPLTYLVPGTLEIFYLREEPSIRTSDGKSTWYIFRWEDQPIGSHKVENATWGEVKNHYR